MNILKNILKVMGGIVSGVLLFGSVFLFLVLMVRLDNPILLKVVYPIVLIGIMILAWRWSKIFAGAMTVVLVIFFGLLFWVTSKAGYESKMFPVIAYGNRLMITSSPPGGSYFNPESGTPIVDVAGYDGTIYYKKQGTVMATLKDVPGLKLTAKIGPETKRLHFDFKKEYFRIKRGQIQPEIIQAIKRSEIIQGMTEEEKIISRGYPRRRAIPESEGFHVL